MRQETIICEKRRQYVRQDKKRVYDTKRLCEKRECVMTQGKTRWKKTKCVRKETRQETKSCKEKYEFERQSKKRTE